MVCKCEKCGWVKLIAAYIDNLPMCEECFDKALGVVECLPEEINKGNGECKDESTYYPQR